MEAQKSHGVITAVPVEEVCFDWKPPWKSYVSPHGSTSSTIKVPWEYHEIPCELEAP